MKIKSIIFVLVLFVFVGCSRHKNKFNEGDFVYLKVNNHKVLISSCYNAIDYTVYSIRYWNENTKTTERDYVRESELKETIFGR